MSFSNRLQRGVLIVALIAVSAFVVSFIQGLRLDSANSAADATDRSLADPIRHPRIEVEVLNAAGQTGLARSATERLRDRGFDVVYFGNAREFDRDSSVVIDRVGDPARARAVADALGIKLVQSVPDTTLLLSVTVLLGKDWTPR